MTETPTPEKPRTSGIARVKLWHLALLVAFVAVAIADIQDNRRFEPTLLALAGCGFAAYWVIGWVGWRFAQRYRTKLGAVPLLALFLTAMAVLFMTATVIYLVIEHAYLSGKR